MCYDLLFVRVLDVGQTPNLKVTIDLKNVFSFLEGLKTESPILQPVVVRTSCFLFQTVSNRVMYHPRR